MNLRKSVTKDVPFRLQDSNDQEFFFNGSISNFDLGSQGDPIDYNLVSNYMSSRCYPGYAGWYWNKKWRELERLARKTNCEEKSK